LGPSISTSHIKVFRNGHGANDNLKADSSKGVINMWGTSKRQIEEQKMNIDKLANIVLCQKHEIQELKREIEAFVSCEVCGCLLHKRNARRGESVIKVVKDGYFNREIIYRPYYCAVHKPASHEGE